MDIQEWIAGTGNVDAELYKRKAEFAETLLIYFDVTYHAYKQAKKKNIKFWELTYDSEAVPFSYDIHRKIFDDVNFFRTLNKFTDIGFELRKEVKNETILKFAGMMWRFYNEILPDRNFKEIDIDKLLKIDFSLAKLSYEIGGRVSDITFRGKHQHDKNLDRLKLSSIATSKKKERLKQTTLEIFHTIEKRSSLKPYSIASMIQKRWRKTSPEDRVPSRDTIIRYLREEKLIH